MNHKYHGFTIYPCEWAKGEHNGRWFVQQYHRPTGIPWADENCPHFHTLAEARERINEWLKHRVWEEAQPSKTH
jgi:hypothetical protein